MDFFEKSRKLFENSFNNFDYKSILNKKYKKNLIIYNDLDDILNKNTEYMIRIENIIKKETK